MKGPGRVKGGGKSKRNRKKPVVDAFGSQGGGDRSNTPPAKGNNKPSKKERRKARSPVGFLVALSVAVGGLAVAVYSSINAKKESDALLRSMRRRPLAITEHAACRMECRFVTKKDVTESLFKGRVNRRKSELGAKPCKKVVVDADIRTKEGRSKSVQNVFSACKDETRLVTAIDTSTNWPCGPC